MRRSRKPLWGVTSIGGSNPSLSASCGACASIAPHDARHTDASLIVAVGAPAKELIEHLEHVTVVPTVDACETNLRASRHDEHR